MHWKAKPFGHSSLIVRSIIFLVSWIKLPILSSQKCKYRWQGSAPPICPILKPTKIISSTKNVITFSEIEILIATSKPNLYQCFAGKRPWQSCDLVSFRLEYFSASLDGLVIHTGSRQSWQPEDRWKYCEWLSGPTIPSARLDWFGKRRHRFRHRKCGPCSRGSTKNNYVLPVAASLLREVETMRLRGQRVRKQSEQIQIQYNGFGVNIHGLWSPCRILWKQNNCCEPGSLQKR